MFFFSEISQAFIAYRIAIGFAVVLEEPVCAEEHKATVLQEFDAYCRKIGLKLAFYRVNENSLLWFNRMKKHKIKIGQEAILEVNDFSWIERQKIITQGVEQLQKKDIPLQFVHRRLDRVPFGIKKF